MDVTLHSKSTNILRPKDAKRKLGIGRTKLEELVKQKELTKIRIGKRSVGFIESELDQWIASRPRVSA